MDQIRGRIRAGACFSIVLTLGLTTLSATRALADRIVLRGGGQIRGKVIHDPAHLDKLTILLERGKTPLLLQKAQVLEIVSEPSVLDEYLTRKASTSSTAEAQYTLGAWCEAHKLRDLAELHFQAAVKADPKFGLAHKKLGHVQVEDRWLTPDEHREAQGLLRYKGKWITKEEKAQHEKTDALLADQANWVRRIRQLREAYLYSSDDRRREAEIQLMAIREPTAVTPLVKVLGRDNVTMRILLAHVLGAIPGPESASALVSLLLAEIEPDVRHSALGEMLRRKEPEINKRLVAALRSSTPEVVNRAGWALGQLDAVAAVPNLVSALITTRSEVVIAPSPAGPLDGGSLSPVFSSVPIANPMYGTPIAYNGSSIGYLTGTAVGPGVAAYGAASVPAYPLPAIPGGLGASPASTPIAAGGGVNASRGPTPRLVSISIQNVEVLTSLVKLTGRDFGYDIDAWKHWLRTSFHPEPAPTRRVPQP